MPSRNNREIVTRTAVAMEQLSKHVSAEKNSVKNKGVVFSVWSMPRGYKKYIEDRLNQLSFQTPACQYMNLGAEELN
jgi:hypothetical protein